MTSSLVGSEMCIRDSSYPVLYGGEPRGNVIPGVIPGDIPGEGRFGVPKSCLLYTSDAADDM
eukprot:11838575-Prorocentrum_lima.AAC.1